MELLVGLLADMVVYDGLVRVCTSRLGVDSDGF